MFVEVEYSRLQRASLSASGIGLPEDEWKSAPDHALFPEISAVRSALHPTEIQSGVLEEDFEINHLGKPIVRIAEKEWDNLTEIESNVTLIGRFVGERPPLETIRATMGAVLRLEGSVQIGSLNRRSILMRFTSESDCRNTWLKSQTTIEGTRIWFSKWTPSWSSNKDSPVTTVWISLPNLPQHLFDFSMISRICAPIGRVLLLDSATIRRTRPNIAKARIEMDVSKPLIEEIWIEIGNKEGGSNGFGQRIEYERLPAYCTHCGRFGHMELVCRRRMVDGGDTVVMGEGAVKDEGGSPLVESAEESLLRRTEEGAGIGGPGHGPVEMGHKFEGSGLAQNTNMACSNFTISFNEWAEKLKSNMGNDELIGLIDEAKREVGLYFENAFKEQHECDNVDDLAHRATALFIEKLVEDRKVVDGPEEMGSCSKFKYSKVFELKGVVNDPEREKTDLGYKGSDGEESVEVQRGVELEKEEDVMQMLSGQGRSDAVIKSQNDGPVDSNKEVDGPTKDEGSCSNMDSGSKAWEVTPLVSKKNPKWKENWYKVNVKEWCELVDKNFDEDEEFARIVLETMEEVRAIAKKKILKNGDEDYDVPSMEEAMKIMMRKIDDSTVKEKYGPKSTVGFGLRHRLTVGLKICKWSEGYFEGVAGAWD